MADKYTVVELEPGFRLAGWQVRPAAGVLRSAWPRRSARHLEPKAMQVLLLLAANAGRFVTKDELLERVWSGRPVTEDCLTGAIHAIRQALGDDPRDPRFIETRTNVGYRLIAPVQPVRSRHPGRWVVAALTAVALALAVVAVIWHQRLQPPAARPPQTIAVLPFANLSEAPGQDYLSAAMTEALILNLAQWPGIRVISRTSVMPYVDNKQVSAKAIADALDADLLLEGSVQVADGRVRLTAQLIDPAVDGHMWAQQFDRPFADVLQLQAELSAAIAGQVGSLIGGGPSPVPAQLSDERLQQYLQARYELALERNDAVESALAGFQQLAADRPEFAPAWLGQAQALLQLYKVGQRDSQALVQARAAAERFEALSGANPESLSCLGQIVLFLEWDYATAERRYLQAIAKNPSDTIARRRYAWLLVAQRRYEQAAAEITQIRLLDPLYYQSSGMATLLLYAGQAERAVAEFERIGVDRDLRAIELWNLAMAHLAVGQDAKARTALVRLLEASGGLVAADRARLAGLSNVELYREILKVDPFQSPMIRAGLNNLLGDSDAALTKLERAAADRDPDIIYMDAWPELASLRTHPRFQVLLAQVGLTGIGPRGLSPDAEGSARR